MAFGRCLAFEIAGCFCQLRVGGPLAQAPLELGDAIFRIGMGEEQVVELAPAQRVDDEEVSGGWSALGILVATAALTEFLFGPIWGSISDRVGRKPILMIGMFGYALAMFAFGISTKICAVCTLTAHTRPISSITCSLCSLKRYSLNSSRMVTPLGARSL